MSDYISREAALEAMGSLLRQRFLCVPDSLTQAAASAGYMDGVKDADIRLRSIPAADVRPVVRGKWITHDREDLGIKLNHCIECNSCRVWFSACDMIRRSYCPNCGADMRREE